MNERLNNDHPKELVHEELSATLAADDDGKPIPFQLQVHLDKLKKQYLKFIRHMQVRLFDFVQIGQFGLKLSEFVLFGLNLSKLV